MRTEIAYFTVVALLLPTFLHSVSDKRRESEALVVQGVELYQKSNFSAAREVLERAVELDPSNDAAQYYLGYLDISSNDAVGALTHFRNACSLDSTNYWYNLRLASLYAAVGKPVQSCAIFEKLLFDKPYDLNILSSLTDVYIQLGKLDQADTLLSRIDRINGPSQYSSLMKLDLLRFRGRYDEFFSGLSSLFEEEQTPAVAKVDMVKKMLNSADPRFNYLHLADYEALVTTCLKVHPADTTVLHFAADFYYSTGNDGKSLELCRSAAPDDVQMKYMELFLHLRGEDYEQALKCCDAVLAMPEESDVKKASILTTKGDCYSKMGEVDAACREYEKALKRVPDDIITLNNYAYLMSCQGKNLSKCAKMSRKVLENEPENPTYLDTYGWILYKQKKYSEAKTIFKKAMLYGGKENPEILDHYAATLQALGETALADGYRRQAQLKRDNVSKK